MLSLRIRPEHLDLVKRVDGTVCSGFAFSRIVPGRLGDFAIDLIAQIVHLALCPAQGGRLVAEDAFGGSLDALFQFVDALAGALGGFGGVVGDAGVEQAPGDLERIGYFLIIGLPRRVEQTLRQQRLCLLGLLNGLAHPLEKLVELGLLLLEAGSQALALLGVAQGLPGVLVPGVELVCHLLLVLVKLASLLAHFSHFGGEPVRGLLAQPDRASH